MSDDKRTKFTPEVREIILEAIEAGNYYNVACSVAGVSYKTFREWIKRGRSADPADAEYRAFRSAVKRAEAEGERKHLKCITDEAAQTWQAAAWFLERKYPKRWAKRDIPPPAPRDKVDELVDELRAIRQAGTAGAGGG